MADPHDAQCSQCDGGWWRSYCSIHGCQEAAFAEARKRQQALQDNAQGHDDEPLSVAREILRLRNEIERLTADVEFRNKVLAHLDDDVTDKEIVNAMKGDLFRGVLDMWSPRG